MRSQTSRQPWLLPLLALCLTAGMLIGRVAATWVYAAGAAVGCALGMLYRPVRRPCLLLLTISFGALLGWNAWHPVLPEEGDVVVTGRVIQEISLREDGQVQTVLSGVTLDGEAISGDAYWTYYLAEGEVLPEALRPGSSVTFAARLYHPSREDNPGGFDFREYLLQRGVIIGLYGAQELSFPEESWTLLGWMAGLRHDLSQRLMAVMGQEHGSYAAAMLLGERGFLPDEDIAAFQRLGIAHILSVSGYHVGVLAAICLLALRPLHWPRGLRMLAEGAVLGLYCLLVGGSAPVVRAAVLFLLWEAARLRHRQGLALHTLCLSAMVQLILSPTLLTSASFQLTYGAMLGLLLLRPRLVALHACANPFRQRLWESLCACVAAQIGILPAQLYWFGELPLLSLMANCLLMGVTGGLMGLYWLTLFLLPIPGLRELVGGAAAWVTQGLLTAIRWLGSFEGTTLWTRQADVVTVLGWMLLMAGLAGFLPRCIRTRRWRVALLGALLTLTILLPLPSTGTTYTQFSVGNADAAILEDEGMVVVIDTGEDGQTIANYLHHRRSVVDVLVLTHLHSDHAGGVRALLDEGIPVEVCYLPTGAEDALVDEGMLPLLAELAAAGTQIRTLSRGDVITLPSGSLMTLWPDAVLNRPGGDANDSCLVLLAEVKGTTLLLTGDMTGTYEKYAAIRADILKVAHHGSGSSTGADFLSAVSPQALLLSTGDAERTASLAARTRLPMYSTEQRGAVIIRLEEDSFIINTYLAGE